MKASIQAAAKQMADFYGEMGHIEVADRVLGAKKAHSVPNLLTGPGQKELARVNRIRQESATGVPRGTERFQARSLTDQTHYTDIDGKLRRFFDGERDLADTIKQDEWVKWKDDGKLPQSLLDFTATIDPRGIPDPKRARTLMKTVIDDVKSYDILEQLNPEAYLAAKTYPTDIFELESLRGTRLWPLTGGKDIQFYNDSVPLIMASRIAQHERSWARGQANIMLRNAGIQISPGAAEGLRPGQSMPLRNGMIATVLEAPDVKGEGRLAVKIGNDLFRTVDKKLIGNTNELETMLGGPLTGHLVPNTLANRYEDLFKIAKDPDPMIKALDQLTGLWKTATLTNPSWLVNNMVGNGWLAFSAGLRPQDVAAHGENMIKTWWNRHNPEITDQIKFTLADGRTMTGTELVNAMYQRGAWSNSLISGESLAQFGTGAQALEKSKGFMRRTRDTLKYLKGDIASVVPDIKQRYGELADMGTEAINGNTAAGNAIRATANVIGDRFAKWVGGPTNKMNMAADDVMKGLLNLSLIEQGYDAGEAAARTTRALFDYHDLTPFETTYLRRMIPFYSWIRSSTSYSLKMMMENPKYAALAPKLQEALDDALAGEQKLPQQLRPSWQRENLAVQVGSDPETRQSLLLMSGLPVEQLYHFLTPLMGEDGVQDFIRYYGNASHPLAKYILGATSGVDPFSGRTIGKGGDQTLSEYTAKQIRPLSELGIGTGDSGGLGKALNNGGIGSALTRFAIGGKLQPLNDTAVHVAALREAKKTETALRVRIARAEKSGKSSLDDRAKLLALYQDMIAKGLESDVPVWAREELSSAVPATGE